MTSNLIAQNSDWQSFQLLQFSISLIAQNAAEPSFFPVGMPTPTTSAEQPSVAWSIPGLTADAAANYLVSAGFDCSPRSGSVGDGYKQTCLLDLSEGIILSVDYSGDSPAVINEFKAVASLPDSATRLTAGQSARIASEMSKLGGLPYSGSDPTSAGNWIAENARTLLEKRDSRLQKTFGRVSFLLQWTIGAQFSLIQP
jgi:hypothetical protein